MPTISLHRRSSRQRLIALNYHTPGNMLPSAILARRTETAPNIPAELWVDFYLVLPRPANHYVLDYHNQLVFTLGDDGQVIGTSPESRSLSPRTHPPLVSPRPHHEIFFEGFLLALQLGERLERKELAAQALVQARGTPLYLDRLNDYFQFPSSHLEIQYMYFLGNLPQQ
ncbi:hypothetical protein C8F01DRAFT_1248121 [Mycena amicta]|nr:hypothetical protein C8F01DRAFT_1248121 [Mycena amicta]